jgi:hypothetical protein
MRIIRSWLTQFPAVAISLAALVFKPTADFTFVSLDGLSYPLGS